MHFDIAWQEVDTVLLDMDGTLHGPRLRQLLLANAGA